MYYFRNKKITFFIKITNFLNMETPFSELILDISRPNSAAESEKDY
jgi:hypothetical protein